MAITVVVKAPLSVPFPAGVAAATLTGALLAVALAPGFTAPGATLTIGVPIDQSTPTDYQPLMVNSAPGGVYPRPLVIPIGLGGYFPIPLEAQNLPANIQVQVQNAGATVSVSLVESA